MTNEQINERIAKLCGWEKTANNDWVKPASFYRNIPPTYTESLDACREFERFSSIADWNSYFEQLRWVCERDMTEPMIALAIQRCEAFLRMKGQWVE